MVFIGAFFLLNLTLAVINSSFSETMRKHEEAKAKEKEQSRQFKVQKEEEDQDGVDKGGHMLATGNDIGIAEFYVAKRAAKKMVEWYFIEKERRAKLDQELKDHQELQASLELEETPYERQHSEYMGSGLDNTLHHQDSSIAPMIVR